MAYVVCEPCNDCKYTDCVAVCPVDCFYQDDMHLWIHPDECIDCEACVPVCPVEAIYAKANVPSQWASYTALNAEKAVALKDAGGNITEQQDPKEGPGCVGREKQDSAKLVNEPAAASPSR
jgi:ferredoxin